MSWVELVYDPNVQWVLGGTALLSVGAGITGVYTFLRKRALVGDAIAHSILPGVCAGFMVSGQKDPLYLMIGALVAGWLALLFMDLVLAKTKLKPDTVTALVLSFFFAVGIVMLTRIQHGGAGSQSGLEAFLFGQAAAMTSYDVYIYGSIALVLILFVLLFYHQFRLVSFDRQYAAAIGLPVRFIEFVLSSMTVLAVASGIQAVGVVLMSALLITPAAAARFWTDKLSAMLVVSALIAVVSSLSGTLISAQSAGMPTGPWIIFCLTLIALGSVFFAPGKGMIGREWKAFRTRRRILGENILKALYHLAESDGNFEKGRSEAEVLSIRSFRMEELRKGLRRLERDGYLVLQNNHWHLSESGKSYSRRIVRFHRLWELYLSTRLNLRPDHVHEGAEAMEHLIDTEIEALLLKELGDVDFDPHASPIPKNQGHE
jgi:manganese/zinc/iron transport system permease protein